MKRFLSGILDCGTVHNHLLLVVFNIIQRILHEKKSLFVLKIKKQVDGFFPIIYCLKKEPFSAIIS